MRRRVSITCQALLLLSLPSLSAQHIRVAVVLSDSEAGGVFQSGFASAMRALGDVEVVTEGENPDYVLSGVVLCDPSPDCQSATSFEVAVQLSEPFQRSTAQFIAELALHPNATGSHTDADSLAEKVWEFTEGYRRIDQAWVAHWGRNAYERAMRELVAEIDSKCFDKIRALRRVQPGPDASRALRSYRDFVASRKWMC